MTSDEQAFMTAILAEPDEDTPRLVFADWLDERGTEDDKARAALIRAQCQAEILPKGSKERRKLEKQAKEILKEHEDRWTQKLRDTNLGIRSTFRRGFIDLIEMSATVFTLHAKKLFEIAPTIRSAYFPDASNEVGRLAKCEFFARLASVDIHAMCKCGYCLIQNDLRALFTSKHTTGLTALNIAGDRMDAEGAKRLAKSAALARLTALDVSENPFGSEGMLALAKSKHLAQLKRLNLSRTGLGDAGVLALAAGKHFRALSHLELNANDITAAGVKALIAAPFFTQLTELNLSGNKIGAQGAAALAALPATAKLQSLNVKNCSVTQKGIRTLTKRFGKGLKV